MNRIARQTWLGLALSAAVAAVQAGAMYRWTDAKGVVHYSDVAVPGAQALGVSKALSQGSTSRPAGGVTPAANAEAGDPADPESIVARKALCAQKKEQLARYQGSISIVERDTLGTDREYTPAEREQLMAKTKAEMDQACSESVS